MGSSAAHHTPQGHGKRASSEAAGDNTSVLEIDNRDKGRLGGCTSGNSEHPGTATAIILAMLQWQ